MFGLFSKQLQEAISPAAAHLGGKNDHAGICDLLFQSSRFTILLTTPLYALCAAYLEPVIKILSGLKQVESLDVLGRAGASPRHLRLPCSPIAAPSASS